MGVWGKIFQAEGATVQRPHDRNVSGVSEKWQGDASRHCNPWKALEWCLTESQPGINATIFM